LLVYAPFDAATTQTYYHGNLEGNDRAQLYVQPPTSIVGRDPTVQLCSIEMIYNLATHLQLFSIRQAVLPVPNHTAL